MKSPEEEHNTQVQVALPHVFSSQVTPASASSLRQANRNLMFQRFDAEKMKKNKNKTALISPSLIRSVPS